MVNAKLYLGMAITLLVAGVILANSAPSIISDATNPAPTVTNQTVAISDGFVSSGETLEINVTGVNSTANTLNYTIRDSITGESASQSNVGSGNASTVTIRSTEITTTGSSYVTDTSAVVNVSIPYNFGWSSATTTMWGLVPLLFALAFLMVPVAVVIVLVKVSS